MPKESTEKDAMQIDGRVHRSEKLVEHLIAEMETYHSHKETMAHAGLLVMLALCGGILSTDVWPPGWVPGLSLYLSPRWMTFLGFFFLWGLLHIYIRWQLRNRRSAAITQAGALRALAEWVTREPSADDLDRYSPEEKQHTSLSGLGERLANILDYVVPFPWATLHADVEKENYPKWLGNALRQQEKGGTGAIKGEWLVTLGSFFVLIVIAVRTYVK